MPTVTNAASAGAKRRHRDPGRLLEGLAATFNCRTRRSGSRSDNSHTREPTRSAQIVRTRYGFSKNQYPNSHQVRRLTRRHTR